MAKVGNETVTDTIIRTANERFVVEREDAGRSELMALAPGELHKKNVLRLQRKAAGTHGRRTLLIAELANSTEIDLALQWSAACKDVLLDPESSDLYLFIILANHDYTVEQCINVEANEKFCRKFILRPHETNEELIERTFLLPIIDKSTDQPIQDPLTSALLLTGEKLNWFDSKMQEEWRTKLISAKSGSDLIDGIFGNGSKKTPS